MSADHDADVDDATMLERAQDCRCPVCEAEGPDYGPHDWSGASLCQKATCAECGASWWECYTLTSVERKD